MSVPTYAQPQQQPRESRRKFWILAGGLTVVGLVVFTVLVGLGVIQKRKRLLSLLNAARYERPTLPAF